jgi:hypothetical protein
MTMFKSSDMRLKDFYYDEGRSVVVSTKCPNEKDIKWRTLPNCKHLVALLGEGTKVLKAVRKDRAREVFDLQITAGQRQAMPYKSSPVVRTPFANAVQKLPAFTPYRPNEVTGTVPQQAPTPTTKYMIGISNGATIDFGQSPTTYASYGAAKTQAEIRAKSAPGMKFTLVQILGTVEAAGITWTE